MFHPKRGQRTNRNFPQEKRPHHLCLPQVGSMSHYSPCRPSRGPHRCCCCTLPLRGVFHPKRGRRSDRTGPQPPHHLYRTQPGSRCSRPSRRPSRGPSLHRLCRRLRDLPPRDVFHLKRGRRIYRNGPPPAHCLCLPQLGSRCSRPSRRPSRGPHR